MGIFNRLSIGGTIGQEYDDHFLECDIRAAYTLPAVAVLERLPAERGDECFGCNALGITCLMRIPGKHGSPDFIIPLCTRCGDERVAEGVKDNRKPQA